VTRIKRGLVYALSMLMFCLVYAFLGVEKHGMVRIALLVASSGFFIMAVAGFVSWRKKRHVP